MRPDVICDLQQQVELPCRDTRAASVGAGVFNGCSVCTMHKDTAEFLAVQ